MAVPSARLFYKTLEGASLLIVQVSSLGITAAKGNILNAFRIKLYLMCQKNAAMRKISEYEMILRLVTLLK